MGREFDCRLQASARAGIGDDFGAAADARRRLRAGGCGLYAESTIGSLGATAERPVTVLLFTNTVFANSYVEK